MINEMTNILFELYIIIFLYNTELKEADYVTSYHSYKLNQIAKLDLPFELLAINEL